MMTIEEMLIVAKSVAYLMGDRTITITELEKDTACLMLKRIADQKMDWSEQQRRQMKDLVDYCKEATQMRRETIQ